MKPELTPKQARFVVEYPKDRNGTQAAIRAGYSPRGADVAAIRLLGDARIGAAIQAHVQRQEVRTEVTSDRTLPPRLALLFHQMAIRGWSRDLAVRMLKKQGWLL